MFKPILHNLIETDKGFKEVQAYNYWISNKKEFFENNKAYSLQDKINVEIKWKDLCQTLLDQASVLTCNQCQEHLGEFYPSHFASQGCESGKRPHCTCDTCF